MLETLEEDSPKLDLQLEPVTPGLKAEVDSQPRRGLELGPQVLQVQVE